MKYTLDQLKAMTDSQLTDLCATNVMGWTKNVGCWSEYVKTGDTYCVNDMCIEDLTWNPLTNWNDTMQIVSHMRVHKWKICITVTDELNQVLLYKSGEAKVHTVDHTNVQRAIVIASILATQS